MVYLKKYLNFWPFIKKYFNKNYIYVTTFKKLNTTANLGILTIFFSKSKKEWILKKIPFIDRNNAMNGNF